MANPPLPVEMLVAVDAACDRFERAWRDATAGPDGPACEDFLADLPAEARGAALGELFAIERQYRAARGQITSEWTRGRPALDQFASQDEAETLAGPLSESGSPSSRGEIHVSCPQCDQSVALPAGEPVDQVTCRACGSCFSSTPQAAPAATEPAKIGRFVLRERLGVGGFGVVWRARDPELDRDVALKAPRRDQLTLYEAEMFAREARAAAQLAHPGIVSVYEVGRDPGRSQNSVYIVSEYVDGEPLSDRLKRGNVTHKQAAALIADIADALDYAHQQGVIHRDLKPANIMLDQLAPGGETDKQTDGDFGRPRLMDFGLAKRDDGEATMTVEGQVLGTPAYMSPEQASGQVRWVDRRTDIYALGAILFHLLTGELPFRGSASMQIQQRLTEEAPSPRQLNDGVPLDLANVCRKCLEREINRRYATSAEVAAEMRRYLAGEPVLARPLSWWGKASRWAQRRPASATALGLAVFLAVAGPAAALRIAYTTAGLIRQQQANVELVERQEKKIDALTATISDQITPGGESAGGRLSPERISQIERLLDNHGEDLFAAARSAPAGSPRGVAARLALARLLLAVGRTSEAAGVLAEVAPATEAPTTAAASLREALRAVEADHASRLADAASPDRATAEARLRATADRQRRLDQLFTTGELAPEDLAAIVAVLVEPETSHEEAAE